MITSDAAARASYKKRRNRTGGGLSGFFFLACSFDGAMIPDQFPATNRMIIGDDGVMREGGQ